MVGDPVGEARQPGERRETVVEAGVVEPPSKDGSSVVCGVELQLLSCVAQLDERVRIVGHQEE
jgi:hypothetical protein